MNHEIVWSADASVELTEIVEFQKVKYGMLKAAEVYKQIRERLVVLVNLPETGRIVPELSVIGISDVREVIYANWRILYGINKNRVDIFSIIDGRRNLEEILFRKFMDRDHP